MPEDKLSAKEAALVAAARAAVEREEAPPAAQSVAAPAEPMPEKARNERSADMAERLAAMFAAERERSERLRRRQRLLLVWTPSAFAICVGLWTLVWMWRQFRG